MTENDQVTNKETKALRFNKTQLFTYSFFGILIFLLYQLLKILAPFFGALLVAIAATLIFYPFHCWIRKKVVVQRTVASTISTTTATLTLLVPLLLFGYLLAKESRDVYPKTSQWLMEISKNEKKIPVSNFLKQHINMDVADLVSTGLQKTQEVIVRSVTRIVKDIFFFIINFIIVVVSMFALFKDGEIFLHWIKDLIPIDTEYKNRIAHQLYVTTLSIVRGLLLTAIIQGIIGAIGYAIAGVPAPVLFGFLTSCAAMVPFLGTGLIWVPLSIGMFMWKGIGVGLFVLIWGAALVGTIDNFLKPILIGRSAKLPIFLLFLGLFGGMRVYGAIGLFLGPILVSCVLIFLQIYLENKNSSTKKPE